MYSMGISMHALVHQVFQLQITFRVQGEEHHSSKKCQCQLPLLHGIAESNQGDDVTIWGWS